MVEESKINADNPIGTKINLDILSIIVRYIKNPRFRCYTTWRVITIFIQAY